MTHRQKTSKDKKPTRRKESNSMDWNEVLKKLGLDELPVFEIVRRDKSGEVLQYIKIFW
jgi:hypothetical protein